MLSPENVFAPHQGAAGKAVCGLAHSCLLNLLTAPGSAGTPTASLQTPSSDSGCSDSLLPARRRPLLAVTPRWASTGAPEAGPSGGFCSLRAHISGSFPFSFFLWGCVSTPCPFLSQWVLRPPRPTISFSAAPTIQKGHQTEGGQRQRESCFWFGKHSFLRRKTTTLNLRKHSARMGTPQTRGKNLGD